MKKVNLIMIILWSILGLIILSAIVGGIFFNWDGVRFDFSARNAKLLVDESIPAKDLETVIIDLSSDMCRVLPTDGDNVLVKHYGRRLSKDRYARVSTQQNGSLTVSTRYEFTLSSIFQWNEYSLVEVYLPVSYKEKLDIDISSGTLDFEDALVLSELGIHVSSGTVRSADSVKAPVTNISVNSGTIRLTGGLEADKYGIKVSSGTVDVDGLKGSGNVEVHSGTIKLSGVDIKDSLNAKASSGTIGIEIAGDPALNFSAHASSGTIRTYFDTLRDKNDNYIATVGDAPYKDLSVAVTSGTVKITQE